LDKEDVNVVAHRIDLKQRRLKILENAGDIGMKLSALLIP